VTQDKQSLKFQPYICLNFLLIFFSKHYIEENVLQVHFCWVHNSKTVFRCSSDISTDLNTKKQASCHLHNMLIDWQVSWIFICCYYKLAKRILPRQDMVVGIRYSWKHTLI